MMVIEKMVRPLSSAEAKKIPSAFSVHEGGVAIHCKEHDQTELVDQRAYHVDLGHWYDIGLHPRFSILDAFRTAAQTGGEAGSLMGLRNNRKEGEALKRQLFFKKCLSDSKTEAEFLAAMHPHLSADLVSGDTTYRMTNQFNERWKAKAFTTDDFFNEPSQEIRRLILRSGLAIRSVTERLTLAAEDEEGKLYRMKTAGEPRPSFFQNSNEFQYLYVVCPSTRQEYLLGVPVTFSVPKEARRWTFGLETNAEFVKEA
jgi:hypothetical protein